MSCYGCRDSIPEGSKPKIIHQNDDLYGSLSDQLCVLDLQHCKHTGFLLFRKPHPTTDEKHRQSVVARCRNGLDIPQDPERAEIWEGQGDPT